MSPQKAVTILVEVLGTATPYVDSIELVGEHDAREVLEALRVVLNEMRALEEIVEHDRGCR